LTIGDIPKTGALTLAKIKSMLALVKSFLLLLLLLLLLLRLMPAIKKEKSQLKCYRSCRKK
tara:strand:- start:68 stop:250 length:183 start_codon:yes stop_codon:yes gene_type:complete